MANNPATHKVEVVPVVLEKHPNADSLSIVRVYHFTVCVRTEDWTDRSIGAYIQPDSVCPDTPEYAFLKKSPEDTKALRIRVKKMRGVISMGLLVPAPEGSQVGDDVAAQLGITHYEPPISEAGGEAEPPPTKFFAPKFDVESMYRYAELFQPGELVIVTEKIDGQNARFSFDGERMWTGSKSEWKRTGDSNWWRVLKANPWIEEWCRAHVGLTLYGEIFGWVQSLRYGAKTEELFFRVFDVWDGMTYWDGARVADAFSLEQCVPSLGCFSFDLELLKKLAEGPSLILGANHMREGIVVRPAIERTSDEIGRVILKLVSNEYLEKAA